MTTTRLPKAPSARSDDQLLDAALDETFPASDPVQPEKHEQLPPPNAPDSDVHNE